MQLRGGRGRIGALSAGTLLLLMGCTGDPRTSGEDARAGPGEERLQSRLIAAAWTNDVPRARRLIAAGADVNAEDDTQQSAFLIATSEGFLRLLDLTLRHGADVTATDSFDGTGVIRAAERGHWQVVGRLVEAGAPLDHVNDLGWTALLEAVILGDGSLRYVRVVRMLLRAGADPTIADRDGVTALEHALADGHTALARILQRVSP